MFKLPGKGKDRKQTSHETAQGLGLTSLIAKGVTVKGAMDLQAGIKIHGRVLGDVTIADGSGVVLLHAESEVFGSILAERVFVAGTVQGDIRAREVHLYGTANVTGEVSYGTIVIHDGAILNGYAHHKNADRSLLREKVQTKVVIDAK